ncbi:MULTISPECIES: hypothetical protein [unclassified Fusobacterium]|uniref:hypothetical protein n=1 Tax=unclassified Fusobacterium TaxID=2648384 RepID=UPI001B8C8836|nr:MULTISPECIES: hypothetical protein [unclassified Fusobacterium]MBR8702283.1 hypothetical protein [Fusobacterium sp. DD45]MBR8712100.1 hypothetical protein [Fusobacterium sp. DD28]MBR8752678.1 hypothetical protein [Fusobacterium sp. DD26]
MIGLDRAAVWVSLADVEADLVILGVQKRFKNVNPRKLAGTTQSFKINENNINEIRVCEKTGYTLVKIDFSYARFGTDNNVYPLCTEAGKVLVENQLVKIIKDISLKKISRNDMSYEYLEICLQERIKSFYSYYNIISLFYKSLKRNNYTKIGTCFEDYDYASDYYYNTGFIFQMNRGWKMRLYSKSHEHNKKNLDKVRGANLRLEHRMTKMALDFYCKTSIVSELKLQVIKEKILVKIGKILFEHITKELYRDIGILEKRLKDFESRKIPNLIRDLQEHILDEKIVNQVIQQNSTKGSRQTRRYKNKVKEALKEYETRGSPKRSNFDNLERLEFFINKIIFFKVKVKCNSKKHLTFDIA